MPPHVVSTGLDSNHDQFFFGGGGVERKLVGRGESEYVLKSLRARMGA